MRYEEILDLITNLFKQFNDSIDTGPGSAWRTLFAEPLAGALSVDADDVEELVVDRLRTELPRLGLGDPLSPANTILVNASRLLLEPLVQSLEFYRRRRLGLSQPELLSEDAANELAGNFFVRLRRATYSVVKVRIYVSEPVYFVLDKSNIAYAYSGKLFVPTARVEVTPELFKYDEAGNLYYIDVEYTATVEGTAGQIKEGEIYTVMGIPQFVAATNPEPSTEARDAETPVDLARRIITSISERSLVTERGIRAVITNTFANVDDVYVVGFGHPEMLRDVITLGTDVQNVASFAAGSSAQAVPLEFPTLGNLPFWPTNKYRFGSQGVNIKVGDLVEFVGKGKFTVVDKYDDIFTIDNFTVVGFGRFGRLIYDPTSGKGSPLGVSPLLGYEGTVANEAGSILYLYKDGLWVTCPISQWSGALVRVDANLRVIGFGMNYSAVGNVVTLDGVYSDLMEVGRFGTIRLSIYDNGNPLDFVVGQFRLDATTTELTLALPDGYTLPETAPWTLWVCPDADYLRMETLASVTNAPGIACRGRLIENFDNIPWIAYRPNVQTKTDVAHVGGKVDIYVKPSSYVTQKTVLRACRDSNPIRFPHPIAIYWNENSEQLAVSSLPLNLNRLDLRSACISLDPGKGMQTYPVIGVGSNTIETTEVFGKSGGTNYALLHSPDIRVPLSPAVALKITGNTLRGHVGSKMLYCDEPLLDVEYGDILYIERGANQGEYTILDVKEGALTVDKALVATSEAMQYKIYTRQTETHLPLLKIDEVIAGEDIGLRIPYGKPVRIEVDASEVDTFTYPRNGYIAGTYYSRPSRIIFHVGPDFPQTIISDKPLEVIVDTREINTPPRRFSIVAGEKAGDTVTVLLPEALNMPSEATVLVRITGFTHIYKARAYFVEPVFCRISNDAKPTVGDTALSIMSLGVLYESSDDPAMIERGNSPNTYILANSDLWKAKAFIKGTYFYADKEALVITLPTGNADLAGKSLIISVDSNRARAIYFKGNNPLPLTSQTYPGGIVEQINSQIDEVRAIVLSDTTFALASKKTFTIYQCTAAPVLGIATPYTNAKTAYSKIIDVMRRDNNTVFVLEGEMPFRYGYFKIVEQAAIGFPGTMQYDESLNLYYIDFLVSSTGPIIGKTVSLDKIPYYGWYLESENAAETFSASEKVTLVLPCLFFDETSVDITGPFYPGLFQQLTITYRYDETAKEVNDFVRDSRNRVVCADLLAYTARPIWLIGSIAYKGGTSTDTMLAEVTKYVNSKTFGEDLDTSKLRNVLMLHGALDIQEPIKVACLRYDRSRSLVLEIPETDLVKTADTYRFLVHSELLKLMRYE